MKSAYILRRQYLILVDAFSGKKSILTKPAIRPVFPNPVTYIKMKINLKAADCDIVDYY